MTAFTMDNDKTCYKCKRCSNCHAEYVIDELLENWPIDHESKMDNIYTWQFLYNVLAWVCLRFEKVEDE